jgi:uncharacterized protein YraI
MVLALPTLAAAQGIGVAQADVNLRSGPGASHARITVIPAGAQVQVHGCGAWCRVTYDGRSGWVAARYVGRGVAARPADVPSEISAGWTYWDGDDSDWSYFRYPYGYWFTSPGGYWWTSPGVVFRF